MEELIELEFQQVMRFPEGSKTCNSAETFRNDGLAFPTCVSISQNLNPAAEKVIGQDMASVAIHKGYYCAVVCDGHGESGHLVAQKVCTLLPKLLLQPLPSRPGTAREKLADDFLTACFYDCNQMVSFPMDPLGQHARIVRGQHADQNQVGTVIEEKDGFYILDFSFLETVHLEASKKQIEFVEYNGGCTCICVVIDLETKYGKVMNMGDSGMLLTMPHGHEIPKSVAEPMLIPFEFEKQPDEKQFAYYTVPHTLSNDNEENRIKKSFTQNVDFMKDPETRQSPVDGAYTVQYRLSLPGGKSIVPTRGFGDVEFSGSGYINSPEISGFIHFAPESYLMLATDGVFDAFHHEEDLLSTFLETEVEHPELTTFCSTLYEEILNIAYDNLTREGIDDITLLIARIA